jgi:hypothetical protein
MVKGGRVAAPARGEAFAEAFSPLSARAASAGVRVSPVSASAPLKPSISAPREASSDCQPERKLSAPGTALAEELASTAALPHPAFGVLPCVFPGVLASTCPWSAAERPPGPISIPVATVMGWVKADAVPKGASVG